MASTGRYTEIRDIACRIVREQGWSALSVRRLAARSDVAIGTVRHYFPTQAELYEAVARQCVPWDLEPPDAAWFRAPVRERLAATVERLGAASMEDSPSWLVSLATMPRIREAWWWEHPTATAWFSQAVVTVRDSLRSGQHAADHTRRDSRDLDETALLITACVLGVGLLRATEASWDDDLVGRLPDLITDLFLEDDPA